MALGQRRHKLSAPSQWAAGRLPHEGVRSTTQLPPAAAPAAGTLVTPQVTGPFPVGTFDAHLTGTRADPWHPDQCGEAGRALDDGAHLGFSDLQ